MYYIASYIVKKFSFRWFSNKTKHFFLNFLFLLLISLAHEHNTMTKYRCTHIDQCNTWNRFKQSITFIKWISLEVAPSITESAKWIPHRGHMACRPPSTGIWAPVMKEALSDARKAIVLATSSTCPGRPNACVVLHLSRNWKMRFFKI